MTTLSPVFELERRPIIEAHTELIREVQDGLRSRPRSLKPWMFYDELGSRLFARLQGLRVTRKFSNRPFREAVRCPNFLRCMATPSTHTFGYFNRNIVAEYPYERSVIDKVNVPFEVAPVPAQTLCRIKIVKLLD